MVTIKNGSIELNLGIVKLAGDLGEEDRQCAWELYCELSTRVAVTGKRINISGQNDLKTEFEGEVYIESLNSLYNFFLEARGIMRKFPVGKLSVKEKGHLGIQISNILSIVIRPFLESWQVKYRHWWEEKSNPRLSPLDRQAEFPELDKFLRNWQEVRMTLRELEKEIVHTYQLVEVD